MTRIWHSVAFRLALICGVLVIAATVMLSTVFYVNTIGVLNQEADKKIKLIGARFSADAERDGIPALALRIAQALSDGVDSDTEIYLLMDPAGNKLVGNIPPWTDPATTPERIIDHPVVRDGRPSAGRMMIHRLSDGSLLVVGRDMGDLNQIDLLIGQAIVIGGILALVLAVGGTLLFRRQIERRIWAIRNTASNIEAGNLSQRVPVSAEPDEFDRLSTDINRMLDRIEHLMEGVRHVSNTIAHNLRTPLGRIRGHLDEALQATPEAASLRTAGYFAIDEIDGLIAVLEKLLQIAEAESGARRQPFQPVALREVVTNLLELYDAAAEEQGLTLVAEIEGEPMVLGDKDLLAGILANLLDNALKYAGNTATVKVRAIQGSGHSVLIVQDNGPGIPHHEYAKVLERFYRLDHQQDGSGLGLPIVAALTQLHGGELQLENAAPGLRVRLSFPAPTLLNGNAPPGSNRGLPA